MGVTLGAVAYDPKVVTIWEGFKSWFIDHDLPFDFVLYSNYERLVEGHLLGEVHAAWNSPLAWIEADRAAALLERKARAVAMRDTDRDLSSIVLVRAASKIHAIRDLAGKGVAVGAADSPQATLIPVLLIADAGLRPGTDFRVERHDVLVGKHGDHVGGERDAFESLKGGAASACAMLDLNWDGWTKDGTIDADQFTVIAETDHFDHCVFTARHDLAPAAERRWVDALFAMQYDNPAHREMMDLEGLKAWLPGRTSGFGPLAAAVASERFFERSGSS